MGFETPKYPQNMLHYLFEHTLWDLKHNVRSWAFALELFEHTLWDLKLRTY